jgi:hypothetical protein
MVAKRNRKRDIYNLTYGLEARVIEEKQDFSNLAQELPLSILVS